ncbi:MAG: sulfatase-like hydrolase/transferase [Bdellovibrionales bacterium]|nr:sulfatase-like hydrolase/transferase [Bdellovibrionales bacterium]
MSLKHSRRYWIVLSLANLVFIRQWSDLLNARPFEAFYENLTAYPATVWALYAAVLVLSAFLYALFRLCGRAGYPGLAYLCFLPPVVLGLNGLRQALNDERLSWGYGVQRFGTAAVWIAMGIVLVGSAFVIWRWRKNVVRTLPLAFSSVERAPRALPHADRRAPQRVFWLVFDGMDYRATFPDRPADLDLPNLDALRSHADFYTDAHAPGDETNRSLPGYLMGRSVDRALLPLPGGGYELEFDGATPTPWKSEDSLFARARSEGASSAIVGWHLPYCELVGHYVDSCRRYPHYNAKKVAYVDTFGESFENLFSELFRLRWRDTYVHVSNYQAILQDTLELVDDTSVDLVFVHWPIPHNPVIFDGKRVSRTVPNLFEGHFKNLKLADLALGRVIEKLQTTGQWKDAAVFVTSDHPSRAILLKDRIEDPRVPLLIKNPGQTAGREVIALTETTTLFERALELLGKKTETLARNP